MILPCRKFCQVTSLGVVPRSRKVLLQLSVGTSNGFSTNLHGWWCQQQCCQYQSAVVSFVCLAPFLIPDTCRGEFLFFLPNQRKWISKKPCCYNCGTPPALFWSNPLPSSVNPCEGILVPKGWPCVGFMPFWNTCEQGDTQALPGFPSPPQLEVLPPPCNHTVSSPSAGVQWEEILLPAKDLLPYWVLGMWLLPVRLFQGSWQHHLANASVYTVVLAWW